LQNVTTLIEVDYWIFGIFWSKFQIQ